MNASKLLKQKGINFDYSALSISAEDVIIRLIDTVKEWKLGLKLESMKKQDLLKLIDYFGGCVIDYHPENYHQERAVLLIHSDMLKKYGLTDEDICRLDFC